MNYAVLKGRTPWVFSSLEQARKAASGIFQRKGVVVAIVETTRAPTHYVAGES
jgi:hypothetical protein